MRLQPFPFAVIAACTISFPALAAPGHTELVNRRNPNVLVVTANGESYSASASPNGRYVAFYSLATDLVPGDTNNQGDVFVSDQVTGAIERVSVSSTGAQINSYVGEPAVSNDGRYVAFASFADNLVPGDHNEAWDVFLRDRLTGLTTRVSVPSTGGETSGSGPYFGPDSFAPSISADGRFIAFKSFARNLAAGTELEFGAHAFVHDRQTGTTTLVSASSAGVPADAPTTTVSISADGRYFVFVSAATNLVTGDTNGLEDVFVRDRQSGVTTRVSVSSSGAQSNGGDQLDASISADGRYVAFSSNASNLVAGDTNNSGDIFVRDRQSGTTQRVSLSSSGAESTGDPNDAYFSLEPSISADGRYVSFRSRATNLVAGDTNNIDDIFVRDRQTGTTTRISVGPAGRQSDNYNTDATISTDGRYVTFGSYSDLLIAGDVNSRPDVFVRDRQLGVTTAASKAKVFSSSVVGGGDIAPDRAVSGTGRYVAFSSASAALVPNDTNNVEDVFVRDRETGTTTRVSVDSAGNQANATTRQPLISADGRYVAFYSFATNLVTDDTNNAGDIFVHDRQTGTTSRVSVASNGAEGEGSSYYATMSGDGRYVAFRSFSNLAGGSRIGGDIYLRDRQAGTTSRLNIVSGGDPASSIGEEPSFSANGRFLAFSSGAADLVPGDTNQSSDIFVYDLQTASIQRVSVGTGGIQADAGSADPSVSSDGRYISFSSSADNLVSGDTNQVDDVFVHDRLTQKTTRVSVSSEGAQALAGSGASSISADGRWVSFTSGASELVPNDTGPSDVFVYDRLKGTTLRASVSSSGVQGSDQSFQSAISGDGRIIAFASLAPNLVAADINNAGDVFTHERRDVSVVRINVGGAGFTDSRGLFWEADRGFNTGSVSSFTSPIANTTDDALYQNERWDQSTQPELEYRLAVPNGAYLVRLHFAENYYGNFGVGRRVFDVDMEGVRRFDNIDIFSEVGARAALVKSAAVNVRDGELNIVFRHQTQNPIIDAIEVIGR